MLTWFPKARTIIIREKTRLTPPEEDSLIGWLQERGNSLVGIQAISALGPFVRRAWRAGPFKTVKAVGLRLQNEEDRALITDGAVSGVESLVISLSPQVTEPEQGALGCTRHFAALRHLRCRVRGLGGCQPPALHPAVARGPSSRLPLVRPAGAAAGLSPRHDRVQRSQDPTSWSESQGPGDEATACGVRSLIQSCASTVRSFALESSSPIDAAVEVVEGLASCQNLDIVQAPPRVFETMPMLIRGSITFRLVHLRLSDGPVDGSDVSSLELWGVMARGGFPVLQSLWLQF
jgi:hypothetical protein